MSSSRVYTVGQVLTAAQLNDFPQGILGRTTGTVDVGPTSGTTTLDILAAPAVTIAAATRRIKISFHARSIDATAAGDNYFIRIQEGATVLNESLYTPPSTAGQATACDISHIIDGPSAGSHTYKVTITRGAGTSTATVRALSTAPMFINVEDVGAL